MVLSARVQPKWKKDFILKWCVQVKSSRNKKDLNNVSAALFSMSFSQLPAGKKNTENGAAMTSLRLFLFCDDFIIFNEIDSFFH